MWYVKNVPVWERVLRVAIGLAVVAWAIWGMGGLAGWVTAASAAGLVMSGLVGFCPACAMVGRRIGK